MCRYSFIGNVNGNKGDTNGGTTERIGETEEVEVTESNEGGSREQDDDTNEKGIQAGDTENGGLGMFTFLYISFVRQNLSGFPCPMSGNFYYPHPRICSKFIECNYGLQRVIDCIPGLYYNPERTMCDFPENVNCGIQNQILSLEMYTY